MRFCQKVKSDSNASPVPMNRFPPGHFEYNSG